MFDRQIRRAISPGLERVGEGLARAGVRPMMLTGGGWALGVGACVAAAERAWPAALALWLANRLADGLDGPVARAKGASDLGGYLDIVADFSIYGGFVAGVAVGVPAARLACVVLLLAYYVSGTAFLALSSLLERRGKSPATDGRSLRFVGGLAEGAETIAVYTLFCLLPGAAAVIAWSFAAAVGVTAVQRIVLGVRLLRPRPQEAPDGRSATIEQPREATG
ncbi:MAG: CDP-alcohol phosphatidyltransferase family protein [Acidimicrobiales bacterium]